MEQVNATDPGLPATATMMPHGDVFMAMSAPVRIMSSLVRYPAQFLEQSSLERTRTAINEANLAWESTDPDDAASFLGDATLYEGVAIPGCLALLRLRNDRKQALEQELQSCANAIAPGASIAVDDVIGLLFDSGIVSVLVFIRQQGGWHSKINLLGPDHRDKFARTAQVNIENSLAPIAALLAKRVRSLDKHAFDGDETAFAKVPYIDFLTGGIMPALGRGFLLDDPLRQFVQPDTAHPLISQSPLRDEFVWLGSVCSLVLGVDQSKFALRFREIATLVAVYSALFDQLTSICAEVSRFAELEHNQSLEELRLYEERIDSYFREISGPSFTYKKDLRILRTHIFTQWEVAPLFERAQFLLAALNRRAQDKQNKKTARSARITNIILLVLALATLVSVFNDGWQILEKFTRS